MKLFQIIWLNKLLGILILNIVAKNNKMIKKTKNI